jgi:hypothetical protein
MVAVTAFAKGESIGKISNARRLKPAVVIDG